MNNEIQQQCTSPVRNRGVKAPTFKRGFSQLFAKFASVLTSCGLTTMLMPLVLAGSGLIATDTAAANNKCAMANPNSKGDHVSEICWLQLDGVSFTANGSTPLTFDLPDGSTMQVNVVVSGSSGGGLSAAQAPSWSGSQFSGSTGYYTIYTPNRAVLYTPGTSANTTSVKLENIRLFTPNGSLVDHAYELIMADGESSNTGENLDFGVQSGGSELSLLEWLGASPSNNLSIEAHKGSATACGGFGAIDCRRLVGKADTANAAVFTTTRVPGVSPFTVVGQVRTSGTNKQGFAFGLRWGGVKLRKQIAGLLDTADRFRYETINIKGSQMDTATSAAGASGALSYVTAQAVMPGNTITLKESMAGGSSTLAQYDKTISCTNTNVGSSTPLPTGAYEPSSPPTIDLQNKGDNVACTITNTPRIVDLAITKSAPPTVEAGKPFDYVLKIENIGTHAATAATYLDTLPTEFADLVAGAVTCRVVLGGALCGTNHVASGKTASGSIASLPPGAAVEIVIKVTAPAIKKSVTNTATVSLATTDTTVGEPTTKRANNTANATTQILSPVLALTKTASPASFVEGVEGSYTLTVTNTGDLATTGSIEVVDVLPVGLTAGVMPSECASVGGTVTCTYIGALAPGGTKQWTIPVTADVSLVGTSVTNTAAVSGGGSSCTSSAACNSNTVTTPVVGAPKLSIAKSHVGDFIPGVAGIYTLTVSNNGTAATSGMVTVTDTLPTGLSFVSASGAGWACSAAGLTVTCTQSAAIAVGGSAPSIALTVAVALGTANRVTNTANVGGGGDTACPAASRCTTTDITTVNTAASFTVAKHAAVADTNGNTVLGDAGDVITYTFDVSNTGTVDLTQVVVSDAKLPGLVCTIASLPVGATNAACTASNNTYTITAADEAAGEVINTATATAVPPGTITPPTATTPPVTTPTLPTPVASFTVAKHAAVADTNGNTVAGDAGDVITYTFDVSNTGTVDLTQVVVSDAKLPGLVCTLASLPVGATNVACTASGNTYTITAADEAAGEVINTATATAVPPGTIPPPTATTPPVTTPTQTTPVASFTVAKHAAVADTNGNTVTGDAGDVITYTFDVSNTGTVDLTQVMVSDAKLPGLVCTIASLPVGATNAACTASGNTYTITAADEAAGEVINTATATAVPPGTIPPPTATTPPVTTPTLTSAVASFTLAKHAAVADTNGNTVTGDAGDVITYTFDVSNTGTVALTNVVVSDLKLPGLVCTIASLPVGASNVPCTASNNRYVITAADVTAGMVTNIAAATAVPPGSMVPPAVNSPPVDTPTVAKPVASFTVAKHAAVADTNGNTVLGDAGDVITYTFDVSNTGTVDLTQVVVSDAKLPGLVCTIASLPVGATNVACTASGNTYTITAADEAAGEVINTATATAVPPGTITPPTATTPPVVTPTPATPVASFVLDKKASVADSNGNTVLGDAGDVITYTFLVSNTGTVTLSNVVVSDVKLPGLVCTIASLPVGARNVACALRNNTYVITAADETAGKVVNVATATATPPGTMTPPTVITPPVTTPTPSTPQAGFSLAKKASVADSNGNTVLGDAGDVITYTFEVSNTGTVDLTQVVVSDAKLPGLVCTIARLPVGASNVACTASGNTYTITAADVIAGAVANVATATAVPPGTITPPTTSSPPVTTPTLPTPVASFTVAKHAAVTDTNGNIVLGDAGDVITYTFDVSNTGTVDLTQVVVSDAKLPGLVCTIASLPVGATNVACTASGNTYTITAADEAAGEVINTATATAVPPGTITPPTATTPPVVTPTPATPVASFVLDKKASVADSNGNTVLGDAGDVITYTFLVSNTGTVPLTNVVVRDAMLPSLVCTLASLPVGASNVACSANNNSYVITAADEAAGKVTNVATATAVPPGTITPPTATTPPVITPTPATPVASFTLAKHASVADTNGNTVLGDAGDVITYTFDVSNTGTVELQNVRLRDSMLPNLVCVVASLPVGARNVACVPSNNTYSITAADVAAGKVTNIASASAIPPGSMTPPTASSPPVDTPTLPSPEAGFTLAKHASVADTNGNTVLGDAGDVITYTFDVSNTGSVALSNVKVSDSKLPNLVCTIAHLPVGATNVACVPGNNTYVVSPADVAAGRVVNAAIATAVPPGAITPPTAATPPVETPTPVSPVASFTLDKRASVADTNGNTLLGDAGDVITYTFAVSNTGSVALNNVVVSDAKLPTLVCVVASLPVGASNVACAPRNNTYVITAADEAVGKVINVATASAVPPGAIVPPTAVSPPVETPAPVAPVSGFSLVKQASVADTNGDGITGDAGDLITYTFLVSNTGTVQLRDVVVSDAKLPDLVCVVPTLPVGASNVACAANNNTYRITEQDAEAQEVVNTATATATPPGSITPPQAQATVTTPVLATPPGQLRLSKTAGKSSVNIGDLVRYTIRADNTGEVPVRAATLVDTLPVGFSYVDGSLVVSDDDNTGSIVGISPLRIGGLDIAAGGHATVTYFLRVGAGTGKGVHTNRVVALDATGSAISNQASADVELAGDPLLDDSLVLGTVFDDRNADGWQASATALGVHIQGGFAASAYVANSTTIDRGAGPQPLADHSSPMLHGVDVGRIAGRQSEADPVQRNQVVIRQRLTAADFTDDLVLTTRNGSTLRMRADGTTTVEQSGDVARGMSAEALQVERRYGQDAEGLTVDYIIRNNGIDERGIPGVRVASVEGLLMETDSWGRYHLEGVDGGAWTRGRNFILKVDPATLPQGATFTTENPRVRRVTPGVPVRFDFGVKMPAGEIGGGQQLATVELGEVLFAPESSQIPDEHRPALEAIVGKIRNYNGGTLTIAAEADAEALALARGYAVREHLQAQLAPDLLERTQVQVLTQVGEPLLQLDSAEVLGNVLFDTDRATIKPQYRSVLSAIAESLEMRGGGVVAIVGRADLRGGSGYNLALGLRRAKAVYEQIAAALSTEVRAKVRVEIIDNPDADTGMGKL